MPSGVFSNQIENGDQVAKRDQYSVAGYLTTWLDMATVELTTLARYRSLLRKIATYTWFATLKMHELSPMQILKLYKELGQESDSTRRKVHMLLSFGF